MVAFHRTRSSPAGLGVPTNLIVDPAIRSVIDALVRAVDDVQRKLSTAELALQRISETQPVTRFSFLVPKVQRVGSRKLTFFMRDLTHRPGEKLEISSDHRAFDVDLPTSTNTVSTVLDTGSTGVIVKVGWPES